MMRKLASLVGLLTLSLNANAALLKVEYQGEIFQGGGHSGYQIGDLVSGFLYIDTDLAPADQFAGDSSIGLYSGTSSADFVFGHTEGVPNDLIEIQDDHTGTRDYFAIRDFGGHYDEPTGGGNFNTREHSVSLFAWDLDLDFLSGDGLLQEFELTGADFFQGEFSMLNVNRSPGLETGVFGSALFNLSRLVVSVTDVDVRVPEPGTLALLAMSLLGLAFARRRPRADRLVAA